MTDIHPTTSVPASEEKKPLTYGIGPGFQVCASYPSVVYEGPEGAKVPVGITFRVSYNGSSAPITLHGAFTEQDIPKALSSIAEKLRAGDNLVKIGQSFDA